VKVFLETFEDTLISSPVFVFSVLILISSHFYRLPRPFVLVPLSAANRFNFI